MRKTLIIVALLLVASLFGCGNNEAVKEQMLGYISDKYGVIADSFEIERFDRSWDTDSYALSFRPKEMPNEHLFMSYFLKHRARDGSRGMYYEDYLGYHIREDFEADIVQICSDVDVTVKAVYEYAFVTFNSDVFADVKNYDDLKAFAEVSPDELPHGFGITIFVSLDDTSKTQEVEEEIFDALEESWFVGRAELIFKLSEDFSKLPARFGWYVSYPGYTHSEKTFG
jgi:hypothetical protein